MANVLLVSFMIHWGNDDDTYNQIYKDLNAALQSSPVTKYWCETTSFFCVETNEGAAQLVDRVVKAAKMRPSKDRLVVVNANVKTGAAWGNITDGDIYSLMPFVKKL